MATPNKGLETPATGSNNNVWGSAVINPNMVKLDSVVGGTQSVTITASNVTLTSSEALNLRYACSGALTGNRVLIFPADVGGFWIIDNQCSGAFTLSVRSGAGAAIVIPQGSTSFVTSNGTTMQFADGLAADGQLVYAVDSGAADAYVTTTPLAGPLKAGATLRMKAANTNTGASTLNASGTGATAIVGQGGGALSAGMIVTGGVYEFTFDGTSWQMAGRHSAAAGTIGGRALGAGTGPQQNLTAAQARAIVGAPLATLTASNSAALDFASAQGFNATLYAGYRVEFQNILPANDAAQLNWLASINDGVAFITTGTYATTDVFAAGNVVTAANSVTNTAVPIAGAISNAAGEGLSGTAEIVSGGAVAYGTSILSKTRHIDNGGGARQDDVSGANSTATAVDAFRFAMAAGNIASGSILIYGIPK